MATTKTAKSTKVTTKKVKAPASQSAKVLSKERNITIGNVLQKNKKIILIVGGIIIIAALLFAGRGLFIAAVVNGQPISRFSIITELEKQAGKTSLEKEITRVLVSQEALKKDVAASKEEIDKEIAKITKQLKDQGQDLNQILQTQGISQEDFEEDIKMQIVVTEILGDKTKVSDKELDDFIAKNQSLIAEETDQKKARESLRTQLQQQKLSTEYQKWMAEIRKNANILQFVDY